MSNASIPVGLAQLEQIVEAVAHNLYAKWAEEGRFSEEEITKYAQHSVDDTVFIINNYMEALNTTMLESAQQIGLD